MMLCLGTRQGDRSSNQVFVGSNRVSLFAQLGLEAASSAGSKHGLFGILCSLLMVHQRRKTMSVVRGNKLSGVIGYAYEAYCGIYCLNPLAKNGKIL